MLTFSHFDRGLWQKIMIPIHFQNFSQMLIIFMTLKKLLMDTLFEGGGGQKKCLVKMLIFVDSTLVLWDVSLKIVEGHYKMFYLLSSDNFKYFPPPPIYPTPFCHNINSILPSSTQDTTRVFCTCILHDHQQTFYYKYIHLMISTILCFLIIFVF